MLSRFSTAASRAAPAVRRTVTSSSVARVSVAVAARSAMIVRAAVPTPPTCRGFASKTPVDPTSPSLDRALAASAAQPPRNNSLVITAAGPDRPGIVHDLTKLLTSAGANVEESRMSILGTDFAILLRVTVGDGLDANKLKEIVSSEFAEFAVGVRSTNSSPNQFAGPVRILSVLVEGPDQPGIVNQLTKIFVDLKGSVRDLDTDCSNAPFAGYKIFQLKCVVAFPLNTDFDEFEKRMHAFEDEYGFDVQVHEGLNRDVEEEMDDEEGEEEEMDEEEEEEEPPRRGAAPPQRRGPAPPQAPPTRAAPGRGPPPPPPSNAQRAPQAQPRGPANPTPRAGAAGAPRGPTGPQRR